MKKYGYWTRKFSDEKWCVVRAVYSGLATREIASTQNISVRSASPLHIVILLPNYA
jgi:DNA-binding NarL/FixJ family response regulator